MFNYIKTKLGNELCMGDCINLIGSYRCTCPMGYEILADGITCKGNKKKVFCKSFVLDIDECSEGACQLNNHLCVNTLGGHRCLKIECPRNYVRDRHYKNKKYPSFFKDLLLLKLT